MNVAAEAPKQAAPCGSWPSPLGAEQMAAKTLGLSTLRADGARLYWLEGRPAEAGRTVLCVQHPDAGRADVVPAPFDVGSRVHEYGGGGYAVRDGRVVFSDRRDGAVWLIEPGGEPRPVCRVPGLRFADLVLSPDGRSVLAVREDHRVQDGAEPEAAIVRLDLDASLDPATKGGTVLVRGPDFLSSPRLSPDGRQLAWIEWDHPDMPWDRTRLGLGRLGPEGVVDSVRTEGVAGDTQGGEALQQPVFAPDGTLHVCSDRSGWWNLYRVEAGGLVPVWPVEREVGLPPWVFGQRCYGFTAKGDVLLAAIEAGRMQGWRLSAEGARALPIGRIREAPVWLRRDGRDWIAWLSAEQDRRAAVQIAPLERLDEPAIVSLAHPALLSPADVARAEPIHFPGADGAVAQAFYYPPTSARFCLQPGERPPLVVVAHGGPTGMATDALSLAVQWWTTRGIGVVDVNYGGSTGFGRAYRRRLDGQWSVVDVEDCIAACRYLIEAGRADPARIAIRGSSAGGLTVLSALVRSRLFSAATCLYGIGDLRRLAEETHKFESRYMDRLVGPLPEAEAIYDARSPLRHIDAITTPVIFFHGLDDKVVPPAQTRAMADGLRRRGIAAELHEFEGEGHGFRREATIRRVLELELAFYGRCFGFTPQLVPLPAAPAVL